MLQISNSKLRRPKPTRLSSLTKKLKRNGLLIAELGVFLFVIAIFVVKLANYFGIETFRLDSMTNAVTTSVSKRIEYIAQSHQLGSCPGSQTKIIIDHSYVCRDDVAMNPNVRIFDTYDKLPNGREYIYGEVTRGDATRAKLLVDESKFDFGRNNPAKIPSTHWNEDPYNDRYWRFNYYGLQILNDVVSGYEQTRGPRYQQKAQQIIHSFATEGVNAPHSWDDYHAVAFRSMTLINYWWKMRQHNALDIATSNQIIDLLTRQGTFLADRANFEAANNHGVNETAALLLIAHTFPTLSEATTWKALALQRLGDTLTDLIDKDGVLIENSPFYHFYILRKYWNIYTYATNERIPVTPLLKQKLDKMVHYATYILQPNIHPPTIGASLDSEIFYNDEYKAIAQQYPEFKYVVTRGKYGTQPRETNATFLHAGQAIIRNDFSRNFSQHAQAVLQAGDFRSDHSHLDALSVTLNSGEDRLLIDAGLYAYEDSDVSQYFQGTAGHNTVMVDGKNQRPGEASITGTIHNKNYSVASASHDLYTGVNHSRSVAMINDSTFIIYDLLSSDSHHTYAQLFHFDPSISLTKSADEAKTITGRFQNSDKTFTIRQLDPVKDTKIIAASKNGTVGGYCSNEYNKLLSCPQVNFTATGETVRFVTVIELKNNRQSYSLTDKSLIVKMGERDAYSFSFTKTNGKTSSMTKAKTVPTPNIEPVPHIGIVVKNAHATADYATDLLQRYDYPAIVSIPARQLVQHYADTLSVTEIKRLQKENDWEVVNQGFSTSDDLVTILTEQRTDDYAQDIVRGAHAYHEMGIPASSLWFSQAAGDLSSQAATTASNLYPLILPLDESSTTGLPTPVTVLNVTSSTTVDTVKQRIDAAIAARQTLLLAFTRFSPAATGQGVSVANLELILQYMKDRGIKPASLDTIAQSLGYKRESDVTFSDEVAQSLAVEARTIETRKWYDF